ncbi:MAG: single-stranded-DNA-specific exonuclease RecJ [Neomegalonema sp.]|nr:single-stranded-DNA-specific exonuclease RecJ [Neomegalonema sp.]
MLDADSTPAFLNVSRSITGRRWVSRNPDADRLGLAIAQTHQLPELVGRVLAGRGVPLEEARAYLEPTLRELLPDPFSLMDMDRAAERLAGAVMRQERVAIFGDYDVDGAASSAVLARWLGAVGEGATRTPTIYIPDRIDEGYGPNAPAMEKLADAHQLLVAVDCGTLAFEPIAAARARGAHVIIADHHLAGETLPECEAVVNPNRQDDESGCGHLCAAGVVFLLAIATQKRLREQGWFQTRQEPDLRRQLDLVALATVADVAPLIGVNRALVRQGLKVMARREAVGLRALSDVGRLTTAPTAYHLGFVLGPRVNAGGRVGAADLGARLLTTDDADEAAQMAAQLDRHNEERRAIEAAVLEGAIEQIEGRPGGPEAALVWAAAEGWHPGVVGVVASRLKERYNRPSLVIGFDEAGVGKGSGRSVEGVDLGGCVAAIARAGVIEKGGGHRMAAGVTVREDQLAPAIEQLTEMLDRQGAARIGPRDLRLDGAVAASGASLELVQMLDAAGPYGQGAPAPRFAVPSAQVKWAKPIGANHLRFTATDENGGGLEAVAFNVMDGPLGEALTQRGRGPVHLAGRIEIDDYGGRRRAKLRVEDAAEPS